MTKLVVLLAASTLLLGGVAACSSSPSTVVIHGKISWVDDENTAWESVALGDSSAPTCSQVIFRVDIKDSAGAIVNVARSTTPYHQTGSPVAQYGMTCDATYSATVPKSLTYSLTVENYSGFSPTVFNESSIADGQAAPTVNGMSF